MPAWLNFGQQAGFKLAAPREGSLNSTIRFWRAATCSIRSSFTPACARTSFFMAGSLQAGFRQGGGVWFRCRRAECGAGLSGGFRNLFLGDELIRDTKGQVS